MLTLYAMAIASALLLAFLLLSKTDANPTANRWLSAFLLSVAGVMADDYWDSSGITAAYPATFGLGNVFLLAVAPCLWLSIESFTRVRFRFQNVHLLHFLPCLLHLLLMVPYWVRSTEEKRRFFSLQHAGFFYVLAFVLYVAFFQNIVYLVVDVYRLQRHNRNIVLFSADVTPINLRWLQWFLAGVGALLLVWGSVLLLSDRPVGVSYAGILFGLFYYLGYFALRQPQIYPASENAANELSEVIEPAEPPKTSAARLSDHEAETLKTALLTVMETQKPYLDSQLTLPALAGLLGVRPHKLSYVINQAFSENFFQFINTYRVEESKQLLLDPRRQHYNILQIGYEAGFNSKTVFNTTFKRLTGSSPSEYRKQHTKSGLPD